MRKRGRKGGRERGREGGREGGREEVREVGTVESQKNRQAVSYSQKDILLLSTLNSSGWLPLNSGVFMSYPGGDVGHSL